MPRGKDQRERQQTFDLVTGQDSYAGQNAQNPRTSRRLQSLIPSLSGELAREAADPLYLNALGSPVGFLFEYDRVNPSDGSIIRLYFCATSLQLFLNVSGTWTAQSLPLKTGLSSSIAPLVNYPQAVVTNNLMHVSDGVTSWLFDGNTWVLEGMPIPQNAPSINAQVTVAQNITSIARRSGIVTVTLAAPLSIVTGTIPYPVALVIAGCADSSLDGTFVATPVSPTVFTYAQPGIQDTNDTTGTADWNHPAITTNKYYWVSYTDQTPNRGSEQSDVTPISPGTGTQSTKVIEVIPRFGFASITNGTNIVTLNAGGGGGGGATNETKAPTAFTNPDPSFGSPPTTGGFSAPGNAFDGNPATFSTGHAASPRNSSSQFVTCQWNTWAAATGSYSSLVLTIIASGNCSDSGDSGFNEAVLDYSLDGGTTWHNVFDIVGGFGAPAGISKTFIISIPSGIPLGNIIVRASAETDASDDKTISATVTVTEISTTGVLTGTSGGAGTGGLFTQADVGQNIYIVGNNLGTIASVQNQFQATLNNTWNGGNLSGNYLVAPVRATHWFVYASESENSQVGFQLAIVPITTMFYVDSSPFVGSAGNLYQTIERPVRNDPPVPSLIQTIHKNRIFRRRETNPRNFNYTAYEEVLGNLNGSPQESTPGTDPNTLSDIVNEDPLNDDSALIRNITSHGDALYLGSERNVIPLYGQSIDSFTLSNLVAFKVGVAGRFAAVSTPHGLCFVSYDKKVYMYPSQYPPGLLGGDTTQYLIELSRPLRTLFENMLSSDLDNVRLIFYNYGRRNWLVLAFQDSSNVYHTWVYDFETQGWFELQRGVSSLVVFEIGQGNKVLMGGDAAGQVYVLDDLTGTFTSNANLPAAIFRPALINWGKPDHYHVFRYVEFEVDNVNLGASSITINYYFDPVSADAPGVPDGTLTLSQVRGSNFFRGFAKSGSQSGGSLCYRMLLEILVASDQNAGVIRGLNIVADEAASLIF